MPRDSLSPKHLRFVEEYRRTSNATEAARLAGYATENASKAGWRLLQRPEIQAALKAATAAPAPVKLRSGLEISFSFEGKPIEAFMARAVSEEWGSATELEMWRALSVLTLIAEP